MNKFKFTKEQVFKFIEDCNEDKLREISRYFFFMSGHYQRIIWHFAHLLTFDYLVVPSVKDKKVYNKSPFKEDMQMLLDYTDNAAIAESNRFITLITLLDGVFYGYERRVGDTVTIQQLPPSYCRSKYKINGTHAIEFNIRFFDNYKDYDIEQKKSLFSMFPDEFLDLYVEYKQGGNNGWVQLNPVNARCHKFIDSPIPIFSTVFPDLINLQEYKELDKTQSQMDLYKLIIQELPIDKNTGLPLLKLEESQELHKNAKKMITQEGIDVITTPLKVQSVNLQDKGQTLRDNIERANNSIYDVIGSSKLVFSGGKDAGSIGLNNSIKTDESMLFGLLDQYVRWYNNRFSKLIKQNTTYKFEMFMPPITIYNQKEKYDMFKDAATMGYSKLMPIVAMGVKQSTFVNLLQYENDFLGLQDIMLPLQSSHTLTNDNGGRPQKETGKLTPSGEKTRNTDANKNRAK